MREYKFRGKRIDNGEWVYGNKGFMQELLKRLKTAWTILRKGMYQYQEIILTQEDAGRLYEYLGRVRVE